MQGAFLTVIVVVGVVGLLGALVALALSRGTWESIGRDRLLMESDLRDPRTQPRAGTATPSTDADDEREAEIRQMLEARNRRRRRHGEPDLDVETELARLLRAPAGGALSMPAEGTARHPPAPPSVPDPELVAEIRQLVIARNHRRARRGRPPLDVEAEIERQIALLNG